VLALQVPLHDLAEITARLTLVVFAVVNVSLIAIKRSHHRLSDGGLHRASLDAMGRSRGVRAFASAGHVDHPTRLTYPGNCRCLRLRWIKTASRAIGSASGHVQEYSPAR
jgi:hypothetical protein